MQDLPLKWHGGKQPLMKWLISHLPEASSYKHRVEVCGGGLSWTLMQEQIEGVSEVVNDLDGYLTNFWRCLQNPTDFEDLVRLAQATPVSEASWDDAQAILDGWTPSSEPDAAAAWAFFVQVRQSRQGLRDDFCTLSKSRTRRGMNEQASAWWTAVDALRPAHERLGRVVVLCMDAVKLIRQEDSPQTLFYVDPPYFPETRSSKDAYDHEMSPEKHEELLCALLDIKGKFMLSGYSCEMYEDAAIIGGWRKVTKDVANHASSAKSKQRKIECLWMNY